MSDFDDIRVDELLGAAIMSYSWEPPNGSVPISPDMDIVVPMYGGVTRPDWVKSVVEKSTRPKFKLFKFTRLFKRTEDLNKTLLNETNATVH